ncbi:MAG: RNA-binding protein [Ruminococcaceae bacterium]|nr:RNA-binding protein [Oscillospiraceae bacterium]
MQQGIDEKILLAKAADTALLCEKHYTVKALGFLTPAEAAVIKAHLRQIGIPDIRLTFYGGYPDAERCMFMALPEYAEDDAMAEFVSALEISGRDIDALNHRDFLGSLLGLGIRREKIGDILCLEGKTLVFAAADIGEYIISNLDKVGRCGVKIRKVEPGEFEVPKRKFEEIKTTVAALRLDCIVAAALKTSRSVAAEVIKSKRVSVNWLECDNVSLQVNPGDTFSVRGAGRFILSDSLNTTKKGRLGICIEKAT